LFKEEKMIHKELSGARIRHNPLGLFFAALNNNCSAQEMLTRPKLVWLEPTGHEDSHYVRKSF
jgi:hypothetical protein